MAPEELPSGEKALAIQLSSQPAGAVPPDRQLYAAPQSERGACTRASETAAVVSVPVMRVLPPVASEYQWMSSTSRSRSPCASLAVRSLRR